MKLILASKSPQRFNLLKKILADLKLPQDFSVIAADIAEDRHPDEPIVDYTKRLSEEKAQKVSETLAGDFLVLAADTIVVLACDEGKIFGKPSTPAEARDTLRQLSGQKQRVITGFCLWPTSAPGRIVLDHDESLVWFKTLTEKEIEDYVSTAEFQGKSGAYAIQGGASHFVTKIEGSITNIVGLPTEKISKILSQFYKTKFN